ncbi:MAG: EAL domain-containing protein [Anaerolineaceae bacterium]|nr:EAL domain-containing protein [Anaerolineaceae bacterium]
MSTVALKLNRYRLTSKPQIVTFIIMIIGMFIFESILRIFFSDLTHWQASAGTILISSSVAFVCAFMTYRQNRKDLKRQFHQEIDVQKEKLLDTERFYQQVIDIAPSMIYVRDRHGRYIIANQAMSKFYGVSLKELIGRSDIDLAKGLEEVEMGRVSDRHVLDTCQEEIIEEETITDASGEKHWVRTKKQPIIRSKEESPFVLGVSTDNCRLKRYEEILTFERMHDSLTGLPNRAMLNDFLENARQTEDKSDKQYAVLRLDLDQFKRINDALGYEVGNQLLVAVSKRLEACLRTRDIIARLSGDEFGILLEEISHVNEVYQIVERIFEKMRWPFVVNEHEILVTVGIGIVFGEQSYQEHGDILRDADIAMAYAKTLGKSRYVVFKDDMRETREGRLQMEMDLRNAIANEELRVYYQPIIELATGVITGMEALARWEHPKRGLVLPGEFIPVAEDTDLIIPIGLWVMREACRQTLLWHHQFPDESLLTMSVNISSKQLLHPDFVQDVVQILEETGLPAQFLKLEITENVYLGKSEDVVSVLNHLSALGLRLFIDDFGTGYSSLAYLRQMPFDAIKIDRSFIDGILNVDGALKIIQAIIGLAHNLGKELIAEGVETVEQRARLKDLGCKYEQGFLFSKPRQASEVEKFFLSGSFSENY